MNNLAQLKTKPSLIKALKSSTAKDLTSKEIKEQRVSYIVGMKGSESITRSQVQRVLAHQEGRSGHK